MGLLFRLILFVLLVEGMFFVLLRIYLRSVRREALENRWNRRHPGRSGDSPAREAFVHRAMQGFENSVRARLVWLVFVVPTAAVIAVMYWVNAQ